VIIKRDDIVWSTQRCVAGYNSGPKLTTLAEHKWW
jgi:hypothetical protein